MAYDIRTLDISVVAYSQTIRTQEIMLMDAVPPRGHVDGGALASTTDALDYLWLYHKYSRREREAVTRLKVADDTIHIPEGFGYLKGFEAIFEFRTYRDFDFNINKMDMPIPADELIKNPACDQNSRKSAVAPKHEPMRSHPMASAASATWHTRARPNPLRRNAG